MTSARRIAGGSVLLGALLLGGAACTGSAAPSATAPSSGSVATSDAPTGAATRAFTAVRWWSDAAGGVGSPIDVQHPTRAASSLHPSRADYCRMLQQTTAAGRPLTSGVAASDPALQAATTAYLAELTAVAPTQLTAAWQQVGRVLLAVARSNGRAGALSALGSADVAAAGNLIGRDAQAQCHISLHGTSVKLAG